MDSLPQLGVGIDRSDLRLRNLVIVVGIITSLYHIFYVFTDWMLSGALHLNMHLFLVLTYMFLATFELGDRSRRGIAWNIYTGVFLLMAVISTGYVFLNFELLRLQAGLITQERTIMGAFLILAVLEACRRTYGWILPGIAVATILYAVFGSFLPGILNHGGVALEYVIYSTTFEFTGLYGYLVTLSATFIAIFMIFGGVFQHTGAAEYFEDLSKSLAGGLRSGPAQVAILSSGMLGSLTGSASANVGMSGSYSIPLMKRLGYEDKWAGAIEAAASTGGQLMPPVMGAAAFVMADFLPDQTYPDVIVAAALPSLLYYFTLSISAELRGRHVGLQPLAMDDRPSLLSVALRSYLFLPVVAIVYFLLTGRSVLLSAGMGLVTLVVVIVIEVAYSTVSRRSFDRAREQSVDFVVGLAKGGDMVARIGVALGTIAIVVKMLNLTGLLSRMSFALSNFAGDSIVILLVMIAILSILFGFGIPTTAAYVIVALLTAPALIDFGIQPLAAHFFVLYFAVLSVISPPVATAALVASNMAESDFINTSLSSMRLALAAYVLPFLWILYPELLLQGDASLFGYVLIVGKVAVGISLLAVAFEGYLFRACSILERLAIAAAAILILSPNTYLLLLGCGLLAAIVAFQTTAKRPAIPSIISR